MKFERIIAQQERVADDGTVMGDRIRVVVDGDRCSLHHEWMQKHVAPEESDFDWDWRGQPDSGVSMSTAAAGELLAALKDALER